MSSPHADLETRLRQLFDGRYRIDRELLGGGMSRVFLAEDVALGRRIVLKILPPEIAADVNRDRFRREISFAARLQHPHIVPLLAAGEEDGLLYYTMPYIDGSSLKATIAGGRQMRPSEVVDILVDVADALAYAHREGVVHRDIKPANLLMKERHAVITDFGVAKAVTSARSTISGGSDTSGVALGVGKPWDGGMTTAGQAIGTPAYMAPEQLAGDGNADHRVDIYALGLLGYELLCGHVPFRSASPQAMIAAQLTQAPEPITKVRPDVPPMLAALIARCLEKEPQHRPASADAVLEVLRTMDLASGSQVSDVRTIHRNRPTRDAMVAGAAIIATAALAWFTMGRTPPRASDTLAARPLPVDAPISVSIPSDSALRAQASADSATVARIMRDSGAAFRRRYARDSARSAAELAAMEQRLFAKLRDSVANEVRQATADSIMRRQAEIAAATRTAESLSRVMRAPQVFTVPAPPRPRTPALTAEAFVARRNNLGPPRRVAVGLSSSLPRSPDLVVAAVALRDSIIASLREEPRYIVVPSDSFSAAQQRNRSYDSLSAWLRAELFVVVSVSSYGSAGDSVRWLITLRDLAAHPTYTTRSAQTPRLSLADGVSKAVGPLRTAVTMELRNMDMAPRAK